MKINFLNYFPLIWSKAPRHKYLIPDFSPHLSKPCALEQGSRGAGEQGSRGAGEQGRVQCAKFNPLCPSAPLHICTSDLKLLNIQATCIDVLPRLLSVGFSHKRLPEIVPSTAQAEQVRLTVPPTMDNALPIFEQVQIATEKYVQSITYKVLPKTRFSFGTAYLVVVVQCYSEVLPCAPSFDYTRSKRHLKVPESAFIPPLETVGFHPPILFCKH